MADNDDNDNNDDDLIQNVCHAALWGNLEKLNRFLEEDPGRLEQELEGVDDQDEWCVDGHVLNGGTLLQVAAIVGEDAIVARLIELGANLDEAIFWASRGNKPSTLSLLLDAGVPIDARNYLDWTSWHEAAYAGAVDSLELLLARGGMAQDGCLTYLGETPLHLAAEEFREEAVEFLVQAGADPTIRDAKGRTPIDLAQSHCSDECIAILKAIKREHVMMLLKARALLDAPSVIHKAAQDARNNGLDFFAEARAVLAVTPVYLKERIAHGQELPAVEVKGRRRQEELLACLKYALGLEGGGAVHPEGQPPPPGMPRELFI